MFEKLSRSWELFKNSVSVISKNPTLLLFPAFTTIATFGILLFFTAPVVLQPTGYSYTSMAHWKAVGNSVFTSQGMAELERPSAPGESGRRNRNVQFSRTASVYFMIVYFASMFFATFFNAAFCHEIIDALQGRSVSISEGLAFALSRWKPILYWSIFSGLVGLAIRKLEERFGLFGQFIVGLIGIAWSVAAVFAIPVLVNEPETDNPLAVLRTSASRLKKTWGESLIGYVGMGIGSSIFALLSFVVLFVFISLSIHTQHPLVLVGGFMVWLVGIFAFSYFWSVAELVYKCALYLYAANGAAPAPFAAAAMASAWKTRT